MISRDNAPTPKWNWCRGPGCDHTLIEMPYAHCSLTCDKRDREARADIKTKPPTPQTTTVAQGMRELADMRGEYDHDRRVADMIAKAALGGRDGFERRNA